MSKFFLFLLCCGLIPFVKAQEAPEVRAILSFVSETLPEGADLSELSTRLYHYKDHPIDLNRAKPEQLKELVFLSAIQIDQLFTHLQQSGKLSDLLELQAIESFDVATVSRLLPFVTLRTAAPISRVSWKDLRRKGDSDLLLRYGQVLEKQKGFTALPGSRYLGNPSKLLLRYLYRLGDLVAVSLVADKDAGEQFFRGVNKSGFDFISGSVTVNQTGRFSKIVAGDYSLQFGEGLSLWMGTALGRGADVAGVAKNGSGLKPYTSANESLFFRGLAVKYRLLKSMALTPFVSIRNLDASLTLRKDGQYTLNTINSSGLHRTASETGHKRNLRQFVYGALTSYHSGNLNIGFAAYHSSYAHDFITGNARYKAFAFQGKELSNAGLHYNYTFKNTYIFGEAAYSVPGSTAFLNGIMASVSPSLSAVLAYRNYSKKHVSFYSQPLGEGTGAVNENGFYGGMHYSPSRKWSIAVYADVSRFPWLRYRVDQPSSNLQLMGQLSYMPRKNLVAQLKFTTRRSEQNDTSGLPLNPVVHFRKHNLRAGLQWQLNRKLSMENRAELTQYQKGNRAVERGFLVYQDADFRPLSSRFAGGARLAYFNTSSYDSRLYAYEDDVLNGSGSGLYNGRGLRFYINSNYRLSRQLRIWCRYGTFLYPGTGTTGTGLDQIEGNHKSEIRLQLRYKF